MRRLLLLIALLSATALTAGAQILGSFNDPDASGNRGGNLKSAGEAPSDTIVVGFGGHYGDFFFPNTLSYTADDLDYTYDGLDGDVFRHFIVNFTAKDRNYNDDWGRMYLKPHLTPGGGSSGIPFAAAVWWDIDKLIDEVAGNPNIEILEAWLNVKFDTGTPHFTGANYLDDRYTGLYAVLDTFKVDEAWTPNGTAGLRAANYASLSADVDWNYADATLETEWALPFTWRSKAYNQGGMGKWGIPSEPALNGETVSGEQEVSIDCKRMLQYYVDFRQKRGICNSGFWIIGFCGTPYTNFRLHCGSGGAARPDACPSLIVKLRTNSRRHAKGLFFNKPFAWSPTTDDGFNDNLDYAEIIERVGGGRMTAFINGDWINNSGRLTGADLVELHNKGHEIAQHGWEHLFLANEDEATIIATLSRDMTLDKMPGINKADSLEIMSTAAWSNGSYDLLTEQVAYALGYEAVRAASGNHFGGVYPGGGYGDVHGNDTDSDMLWLDFADQETISIMATPYFSTSSMLPHEWSDNDNTVEAVMESLQNHIYDYVGSNDCDLSMAINCSWIRNEPTITLDHQHDQDPETGWSLVNYEAFARHLVARGDFAVGVTYRDIIALYKSRADSLTWQYWQTDPSEVPW